MIRQQFFDDAMKCAKGSWQQSLVRAMASYWMPNPLSSLGGNAKSYRGRYQASFQALISRLNATGRVVVDRRPGPHGGETAATYRLREV